MMPHMRSLLVLSAIIVLVVGCKKDDDPVGQGPGGGPNGPTGAPNSIMSFEEVGSWWRDTSMANGVCLDGSMLTIECHPSMTTLLTFDIPNYAGPDTYLLGPQGSARYYDQLNTPAGSYFTQGTDSSGYVIITSFSEATGLTGSFEAELFRGSTIQIENGVFDGLRNSCALPDSFLIYSVGVLPAVSPFGSWTDVEDVLNDYSHYRTEEQIILENFNSGNIPSPGPINRFRLELPRTIEVGTWSGTMVTDLPDFHLQYSTPYEEYYLATDADNELTIVLHDTAQRHVKGSVSVALSFGVEATAYFDFFY